MIQAQIEKGGQKGTNLIITLQALDDGNDAMILREVGKEINAMKNPVAHLSATPQDVVFNEIILVIKDE